MNKFFDKLFYGGYYMYFLILHNKLNEYIFTPIIKNCLLLLYEIPFFRRTAEKKGQTPEQRIQEAIDDNQKRFEEHNVGFGCFQAGKIVGPLYILFWIDTAIVPFLIFERNILPYPFKGANLIISAAVLGILSFILTTGSDERSEMVVKEYRKKSQKEQRHAFYLFIGLYIVLSIPVIMLIQYFRRIGNW